MEDKQLNAAESIALISRMIENTRNRMLRNSGRPFLVWGYVTVFTTLLVMGAVYISRIRNGTSCGCCSPYWAHC